MWSAMSWALVAWGLVTLFSLGWVLVGVLALPSLLDLRHLRDDHPPDPEVWPRLSVVIAALDEEETIEAALATLLRSTYPNLELVVVDDRSTDRTGEIIDAFAARDPRIRPVHVRALPAGWLGKVHALHQGTLAATGEWLLYTDADVHFLPGCLERAVALAVAERLDHLALWPRMIGRSLWLRAAILSFGVSLIVQVRPHRVGKPGSKAFFGIGAFNLVRRSMWMTTPGFEWLKMEVGDDMAVSKLVVDEGGRSSWRTAHELLEIEWYPSARAMIRGLEKNTYGIFSQYSVPLFILKMVVVTALSSAPFLAMILPGAPWWCRAAGALALVCALTVSVVGARSVRYGVIEGILAPLVGSCTMLVAVSRSAWACWRDGGIRWRGTFYSVEELRRGIRIRL